MIFSSDSNTIESGFGFIESVQGTPGASSGISYTCTFVMSDGVYTGIERQIPCAGRWPDPLSVIPHPVNVPFPAFRINREFQSYMLPEVPDFGPCPGSSPRPSGSAFLWWQSLSEVERKAFAAEIRSYL